MVTTVGLMISEMLQLISWTLSCSEKTFFKLQDEKWLAYLFRFHL